jgi:hypothetical protein
MTLCVRTPDSNLARGRLHRIIPASASGGQRPTSHWCLMPGQKHSPGDMQRQEWCPKPVGVYSPLEACFSFAAPPLVRAPHRTRRAVMRQQHTARRQTRRQQKRSTPTACRSSPSPRLHLHAAGIDVGATQHWVAVLEECDPDPIRQFGAVTADIYALAISISGPAMLRCGQLCLSIYESFSR